MNIAILDFGGQYTHLIAQNLRKLGVKAIITDPTVTAREYSGIILSGGPHSVIGEDAPLFNAGIFELGIPILGICYGHQLICKHFGSIIEPGQTEYGLANIMGVSHTGILKGVPSVNKVWMSHADRVTRLDGNLRATATTQNGVIAAVEHISRRVYGVQFHPEVKHTNYGLTILENFVNICGCPRDWSMQNYLYNVIDVLKDELEHKKVYMLLSGGVDSTVAFALLNRVIGAENVHGLHINTGFMRKDESAQVMTALKKLGYTNIEYVDASAEFLDLLSGVTDPQLKRQIIGDLFINIQQRETAKERFGDGWLLGQGTIYPDTIESGTTKHSAVIKTHHNRVDKIQQLIAKGLVVEPLVELYKDEVRELGELLGLPHNLVWRHPFPGPGLAIRLLCSDGKKCDLTLPHPNATILPVKSVGVQGDTRTYRNALVLSGIMRWGELEELATKLINDYPEINRALYQVEPAHSNTYHLHPATLTASRVALLQELDEIVTTFLHDNELYTEIWQCPVVLAPCSIERGLESVILRPVQSAEAMTANFYQMDFKLLKELGTILYSKKGVGAVLYDITNKPPGTIEWE